MAHSTTQDVIHICFEALAGIKGMSVNVKSSQMLGGGCINQAIRLSTTAGDYFVKWNASAPSDMFLKEAAGLNEMRVQDNSFLKIPEVIWVKETDETPGILILEYLASAPPTHENEWRLGIGLAHLHRKTAPAFGFHHSNYCGKTLQDNNWTNNWAEFYAQQRIWAIVKKLNDLRGLATDELHIYEKLVDRIPQLLAHSTVPSLIHGDLWGGNYMVIAAGPALIDPACYYADREMELGMMKLFGGFSDRVWDAYQQEFPLPEDWKQRIRLYQLYHVLNHYLLFGVSYAHQALEIAKSYV
jgi:protein-ribulosamine 3-kinase